MRLGVRGGRPESDGARIDRVDGPACFQQVSNQQPMGCLDDAGHLFFRLSTNDLLQEGVQSGYSLRGVIDTKRAYLTALFIDDQGRHDGRAPSQYRHTTSERPLSAHMVPEHACPYTVALEARLSHDRFRSGTVPGKCELS